ncbi:MAG: hypothetical protein KHZ91_06470 [Firmicutes bacterium]|nr:hypothetical protein [Bacillota bacterium]
MEQFLETYATSGGLHTLITTTSLLSIVVALVIFFGVARFYHKMSITFLFPLFCIIALICAAFEIGSKVAIGSFPLNRVLLWTVGVALLWFTFHINYSLFKKNWDGIFFVLNLILYFMLGYLLYRYSTVLTLPNTLQNPIFHNFGILRIIPACLKNIHSKQRIIVIVACCIVVACCVIQILLYWHICKNFTWKYTQNERIQKILQIILCLFFIVKPEIAICILGFLPFVYGNFT